MRKKAGLSLAEKGFTLIETLVAVSVLGLVSLSIGGVFIMVQNSWARQRQDTELIQNLRWAMEFLITEARETNNFQVISAGRRLNFWLDANQDNSPDTRIWYWRGDASGWGEPDVLYRGMGNGWAQALNSRELLASYLADNPDSRPIFSLSGTGLTVEMTASSQQRSYSLRSQVRPRN